MAGHGDPFSPGAFPCLQYVLRGIKRPPRPPARPRLPITPALLRVIKAGWATGPADPDKVMLWTACCMFFLGFMRAGEFTLKSAHAFDPSTCLTAQDIAIDHHKFPTMLQIHLKQSKTDPFRHGVNIYLGRTDMVLCPVAAILAYRAIRPATCGPFFIYKDGSPLTRDRLVAAVRKRLADANIDTTGYSGHSFRVGAATTAARVGLGDAMIKMLGRWESAAYQQYIRTPRDSLAAVSSQLASLS